MSEEDNFDVLSNDSMSLNVDGTVNNCHKFDNNECAVGRSELSDDEGDARASLSVTILLSWPICREEQKCFARQYRIKRRCRNEDKVLDRVHKMLKAFRNLVPLSRNGKACGYCFRVCLGKSHNC